MKTKLLSFFLTLSILVIIFLSYSLMLSKKINKEIDISLHPINNTDKKYSPHKTWLISYASDYIYKQNQNNLVASASLTQAFDVIISYQPHHLDPKFIEENKEIITQKRGAGYWLWKPYFILQTLNMMPENDILMYVDTTNIFKDKLNEILKLSEAHDVILFQASKSSKNINYIKRDLIDKMFPNDLSFLERPQLEGGYLILRNNLKSRDLIRNWLELAKDPRLITDSPSKNPEYPEFIDHRHDQAILSALYYKNPSLYYLYDPFPARLKAICVSRRGNDNSSLAALTFARDWDYSHKTGITKHYLKWLIGRQIQEKHCL